MAEQTHPLAAASNQDATRRRRGRSWAILVVLIGLCLLFYAITIVKMGHV
jgi:hypothetical protein